MEHDFLGTFNKDGVCNSAERSLLVDVSITHHEIDQRQWHYRCHSVRTGALIQSVSLIAKCGADSPGSPPVGD